MRLHFSIEGKSVLREIPVRSELPIEVSVLHVDDPVFSTMTSAEYRCLSEEQLAALFSRWFWGRMTALVKDWRALDRSTQVLIRYILNGYARALAVEDLPLPLAGRKHPESVPDPLMRCINSFVIQNPQLNGEREKFRIPENHEGHWIKVFLDCYAVWSDDRRKKTR